MNYRVAVLGLNHYHVTGWVESLAQLPGGVEVVALYDPDPARALRRAPDHVDPSLSTGLPAWAMELPVETDLDALIANHKPDIALVTLPNRDAPAAVIKLAQAGIHILTDKPLARTAAEAEPAVAAARAGGVKLAVALTRRYGRGWQDAAALIAGGRLGTLLSTEAIFVTSSVQVRKPANLIFDGDAMGGGVLHWLGVHDLDLLLWLAGEPVVEVQAMTGHVDASVAVEDSISMAIRYQSGALGTVHYAYALPRSGGEGYLALRGSQSSIRLEPSGVLSVIGAGNLSDPVMTQQTTYESRRLPGYGAVGATIIDDLLRAIDEDRDPLATGEHVLGALRLIDAAYESARTGARVRLPSSS